MHASDLVLLGSTLNEEAAFIALIHRFPWLIHYLASFVEIFEVMLI